MKHLIYKLHFIVPVHFGKNELSSSEYTLCSDTLFSALCAEAALKSEETIEQLVAYAKEGCIMISDAFPFVSDELFLPKPYMYIEHETSSESSIIKKAYKKLNFVPMKDFDDYLSGEYDVLSAPSISNLGKSSLKISASIRNDEENAVPYEVGTFSFYPQCGLYVIVGLADESSEDLFDCLMDNLSLSGLGGEKSSGYGRFSYTKSNANEWLEDHLDNQGEILLLLSTALPTENELQDALEGAGYGLIRRSGFITSATYSDTWQRKNDLYMFKSGSCFRKAFKGDIYDVSNGIGKHPVYRLGIPMFMRVSL